MKEVRVILLPEAEEVYKKLNEESENSKQSRMILKRQNQKEKEEMNNFIN